MCSKVSPQHLAGDSRVHGKDGGWVAGERAAPGWVGKLVRAYLALCGLQGGSSLNGGGISPMLQ